VTFFLKFNYCRTHSLDRIVSSPCHQIHLTWFIDVLLIGSKTAEHVKIKKSNMNKKSVIYQ